MCIRDRLLLPKSSLSEERISLVVQMRLVLPLQTVLDSTKCGTLGGYLLDSFLDGINSGKCIGIISSVNLQTIYTKTRCV